MEHHSDERLSITYNTDEILFPKHSSTAEHGVWGLHRNSPYLFNRRLDSLLSARHLRGRPQEKPVTSSLSVGIFEGEGYIYDSLQHGWSATPTTGEKSQHIPEFESIHLTIDQCLTKNSQPRHPTWVQLYSIRRHFRRHLLLHFPMHQVLLSRSFPGLQ